MQLCLTDDQTLVDDAAARLAEQLGGAARLRRMSERGATIDAASWKELASAGWLGALLPFAAGGSQLGMTELALFCRHTGRFLMVQPAAASAVALRVALDAGLSVERLEPFLDGKRVLLPAVHGTSFSSSFEPVEAVAFEDSERPTLSGSAVLLAHPDGIDALLVPAATPQGMTLFLLDAACEGLACTPVRCVDGGWRTDLRFNDIPLDGQIAGVTQLQANPGAVRRLFDCLALAASAELLGVADRAIADTVAFVALREQFGRPIGSFQALQHRIADSYVEVELTRSLVFQSCAAFDAASCDASAMASACKAKATAACREAANMAIQLHGAMGFTDEADIGQCLKHCMVLAASLGTESFHVARYTRFAALSQRSLEP